MGIGKLFFEAANVLDLGAPPAVNGLVVIAHGGHRGLLAGEQFEPGVLQGVGILKLVHQHMAKALAIVVQQRRVVAQQLQAAQQQLTEIHQPASLAGELVALVELDHLGEVRIAIDVHLMGSQALFLATRNEPLHLAGREALVIDRVIFEQPFDQPELVVGVNDLKVLGQAGVLPVGA